jgi:hypothetical protein
MKQLTYYGFILLVLMVGCTDTSTNHQEESVEQQLPEMLTVLTDEKATTQTHYGSFADSDQAIEYPEEDVWVYTFNDLELFPAKRSIRNPYHGLEFLSDPYMYVTQRYRGYSGGTVVVPMSRNLDDSEARELAFNLPEQATSVGISVIWYSGENPPILSAYDRDNNVVDRDTMELPQRYLDHLAVTSDGSTITRLGLKAHPSGAYYDNLTLTLLTNQAPVAAFQLADTLEAAGPDGRLVPLDGSASQDPDGDALSYEWTRNDQAIGSGQNIDAQIPLGTHTVALTVHDGQTSGQLAHSVTIADRTAPTMQIDQYEEQLWPPNNKMRKVASVTATDLVSDAQLSVSVDADSPQFSSRDYRIQQNTDNSATIWVRAKRSGRRDGRTYTISLEALDRAGNRNQQSIQVEVPHDKGR